MDETNVKLLATGAAGLLAGWLARGVLRPSSSSSSQDAFSDVTSTASWSPDAAFKAVYLIRMDLKMTKGKVAAQCCHATSSMIRRLVRASDPVLQHWEECGQPKITLKVTDHQQMDQLGIMARAKGLHVDVVRDAGHTQVAPGSKTVMMIGPGPADVIDGVTGHLKLY